jgi:hypothetical protein
MKFIVYLFTLFFVGTAIAQNPTILQGSYISNVFGQSNFILNPNAQTSVANVTTVTATVTRSTTTPLVATSEFTVAIGTANGTATWATRAFDAGMKGQNCEARFSYRGFAATSKVHIKQGANTVATLNLTPATDPRIASINFPCGDLSTATTFVVTDTAILAGTNEIGGIYTGLATNQANVAQAEVVVRAGRTTTQSIPNVTDTTIVYNSSSLDVLGEYNNSTGIFTAKRQGRYLMTALATYSSSNAWTAGKIYNIGIIKNGVKVFDIYNVTTASITDFLTMQITQTVELNVGDTASIVLYQSRGAASDLFGNTAYTSLSIARFPTSSELVVTPERQNTFGGAQWTGSALFGRSNTTEITISNANFATNRTLFGKAQFTGTANDVAITIPSMPPGSYKVQLAGKRFSAQKNAVGTTDFGCDFTIKDGTNSTSIRVAQYGVQYSLNSMPIATGVFTYSSLADRTFTAYLNGQDTNGVDCQVDSPRIIITPLDQPSNSALYVQGPVLGAATGAAIPAGYQGETYNNNSIADYNAGLNTYASLTLNPGVWTIFAKAAAIDGAGSSSTNVDGSCLISTNASADPVSFFTAWNNQGDYFMFGGMASPSGAGPIRSPNGSNLTVFALTSTQTVYLRCRLAYAAGLYAGRGSLRAIRLN